MKPIFIIVLVLYGILQSNLSFATNTKWFQVAYEPPSSMQTLISNAKQAMLVETKTWEAHIGKLQRYRRNTTNDSWKKTGAEIPVVIGKNGVALSNRTTLTDTSAPYKKEGDYKTPAGVFTLGKAFGLQPLNSIFTHNNFVLLNSKTVCVDSPNSTYYGKIIDSEKIAQSQWQSGEQMYDYKVPYLYGLEVNYNREQIKGKGSCIFMHVWRNSQSPTAGCVAMQKESLVTILKWLDPNNHPVIIITPKL